ncbi:MAG: hypothetical protein KKH94_10035 [Candidatus Omnitrophica bacterium]|nr:hypothetical protein [Candidatus Omnitrophota bacterium]
MEQKVGIKIEGPTDEKLPLLFVIILIFAAIFIVLTFTILGAEYFSIPLPAIMR